jgi:hypothetical protein
MWARVRGSSNAKNARDYRDRGISVCERWQSFENFLADMGERPPGKTIDRIDNDRGYEPGNCRWATPTEQQNNKRTNHRLAFNGETLTVCEWADRVGVNRMTLFGRLRTGWSVEKALTTPARAYARARPPEAP